MPHYVYILTNKRNGTLYIGETGNIKSRISQHKRKVHPGTFSVRYNLDKLVYFEILNSRDVGLKRERQLKKWNRDWKIRIIEEKNPEWIDLSTNWDLGFEMMDVNI
ncbi:GIY-YIG nuclease family protein [Nonlabens antarcticus]|uniref:GIY-YIG nuclease family protein n=1 Tax=Nonlabens antarcticus TaxID=392714 RepID=UPI0018917A21|nr:GIY-YIG nuclease family protein [Nonlabens antarcticus]